MNALYARIIFVLIVTFLLMRLCTIALAAKASTFQQRVILLMAIRITRIIWTPLDDFRFRGAHLMMSKTKLVHGLALIEQSHLYKNIA